MSRTHHAPPLAHRQQDHGPTCPCGSCQREQASRLQQQEKQASPQPTSIRLSVGGRLHSLPVRSY